MMKRSFLGLTKPRLRYNTTASPVQEIPLPNRVTLLLRGTVNGGAGIKVGMAVKTGQRLSAGPDSAEYVVSSITGTISDISPYMGLLGRIHTAITVQGSGKDDWDDAFKKDSSLKGAVQWLQYLPGSPPFKVFDDPERTIRTLVVSGIDQDLLLTPNQSAILTLGAEIKEGIQALKKITAVDRIVVVVPEHLVQQATATGADVKTVPNVYPAGHPHMIVKDLLGQVVLAGDTVEENGVTFFSAEAVAAIGSAFTSGRLPVTKTVTVVGKTGGPVNVRTRIGTPLSDVLRACKITPEERDRVILGGPMTGAAAYSQEVPVEPATDGIIVQSEGDSARVSDYPCVNCGECVRICPVKVPVNMLVRFLEAGMYEDARNMYDLDCCIECGLCAYVCVSNIPIFQYIRLGKFELSLIEEAEAASE